MPEAPAAAPIPSAPDGARQDANPLPVQGGAPAAESAPASVSQEPAAVLEPVSAGRYDLTRAAADEAMQGRWLHRIPADEQQHARPDGDQQQDGASPKVLHRAFALEDRYRAEDYQGYTPQGVWEVRGTRGGKVVLWRDFTKEERTRMGEIVDARYTIAKTYMLMAHDLSTGRFFRDIAANPEWSRPWPPPSA